METGEKEPSPLIDVGECFYCQKPILLLEGESYKAKSAYGKVVFVAHAACVDD